VEKRINSASSPLTRRFIVSKDINIVVLSGTIVDTPHVILTRNQKRIGLFNLESVERYRLSTGQPAQHQNFLTVEVLGKNVDKISHDFQKGDRVQIHGYLRADEINGAGKVRIRAYHIEKD
jgi:single-stranded DNA-binding protein